MLRKKYLLKTVLCFFAFFFSLLILSPNASATKSWKYTITNHTGYDIVVSHEDCNSADWHGGRNKSPCSNFNDVKISSKTSASRNQTATDKGKKKGHIKPVFKAYKKGTSSLSFTYTVDSFEASDKALHSSYYVQELSGRAGNWVPLKSIWVRTNGESFLNIYSWEPGFEKENWMSRVDASKTIAQIAIPGTHDSGAFSSSVACECQKNSPGQQLDSGVRSFDFRLECHKNELYLTHGSCTFDYEHKVRSNLDYFRWYLQQHPSETIMIHVKEENKAKQCNESDTGKVFKALLEQQEALGLKIMKDYNGVFPPLGEVRGKMMLFNEGSAIGNCCDFPISISWPDKTTGWEHSWGKTASFYIQDAYKATSANKWDIVRPILEAASANSNPQKMYYNYTSCYAPGAPNPAAQASDINEWLAVWLSRNPGKTPAGVIITDYINCTKFAGIVVTQYCSAGGSGILPFMIYSTNY